MLQGAGAAAGIIQLSNTNTQQINSVLAGANGITVQRLGTIFSGAVTLNAANTFIGPLTVSSGLNVVPVFEGWEKNDDGSFNMVFAYLNRNYDEQVDIPSAGLPARLFVMPLPLAAGDAGHVQRFSQTIEERRDAQRGRAFRGRGHQAVIRAISSRNSRSASGISGGRRNARRPSNALPSIQPVRQINAMS